ncbi:MAG: hypothetical protein IT236_13350 [Bacteroidia bacterium]|nr:hypothetical protein [Bacteroidia bacterium]
MPKLPAQLLNSLLLSDGFDAEAFAAVHESGDRLTSVRLNPFKPTTLDFKTGEKVAWNQLGSYVDERPYFTHDPLFHAGCYYVQEAGSMFLEQALTQTLDLSKNLKVLDLCAAPGGKSTLINSLLSPGSLLVANETVKSRADVLAQNLGRWGMANTIVINNFPERYANMGAYFDAIVVDAPCSGSGLFRKQPEAINEWSQDAVMTCCQRQKTILDEIVPTLKENGILVYSTCSYSTEENENIVQWLMQQHQMEYVPLKINNDWGIVETPNGYRFYPHLTQSEGFFCAVLRKNNGETGNERPFKTTSNLLKNEQEVVKPFLKENNLLLHKINGRIHLMNEQVFGFLMRFDKNFYLKKAGTLLGEIKGGKLVPEQELAWSVHTSETVAKIELSHEQAIKYLKKENFLEGNHAQQLVLLTYKNYGLGWAKVLGNRVNNYLPNELRILK